MSPFPSSPGRIIKRVRRALDLCVFTTSTCQTAPRDDVSGIPFRLSLLMDRAPLAVTQYEGEGTRVVVVARKYEAPSSPSIVTVGLPYCVTLFSLRPTQVAPGRETSQTMPHNGLDCIYKWPSVESFVTRASDPFRSVASQVGRLAASSSYARVTRRASGNRPRRLFRRHGRRASWSRTLETICYDGHASFRDNRKTLSRVIDAAATTATTPAQ